jgi:hypothetical protein
MFTVRGVCEQRSAEQKEKVAQVLLQSIVERMV